jgi:flavin reductase (DIM6/NTAB) family NADH-FMN oxidoreductase RutF
MLTFDPAALTRREVRSLAKGLVAPRPIAWVSTISIRGAPNLAPFSFFNAFSTSPLTIGVSPGSRDGVHKDSLRNIKQTRQFTVSMVTESLATRANLSGFDFGPHVNEWTIAGVTPRPSVTVEPPSVAESPASLECQVYRIVDLGTREVPTNSLVIARVTRVHVAKEVLSGVSLDVDPDAIALVARMGADLWCTTRDRFSLPRPTIEEALRGRVSVDRTR